MEKIQALFLISVAMVLMLLLAINGRIASLQLTILNRWFRWLFFGFGGAYIIRDFDLTEHPYLILVLILLLIWLLGETLYNWLAIMVMSRSPSPLFPQYEINQMGEDWPVHPRFSKIRDWLRNNQYRQIQALVSELNTDTYLRVTVYQNADATKRLQMLFIPQPNGNVALCHVITTVTASGMYFQTDNLFMPFGGFYPENWHVKRHPWCRQLERLVQLHEKTLSEYQADPMAFTEEPLIEIRKHQLELERVNYRMHFLLPTHEHDDWGRISWEGRYRIWKEIWLLSYLGRSLQYC